EWVAMATARQVSNGSDPNSDWEQGYGFQFWRARHNVYRGDGAYGQFCIVMPDQDAVVAITSGTRNMGATMNLVWDKILPAFQDKSLPDNLQGEKELTSALAGLKLHMPRSIGFPATAQEIAGKRYAFGTNEMKIESVGVAFYKSSNGPTMFLKCDGVEQQFQCGDGDWVKGKIHFVYDLARPAQDVPMAASGAWTAKDVYTVKLAFYESPFSVTMDLHFSADKLLFDSEYNVVRRGSQKQPELEGRPM
ncbi:MAG TPA: serine hydrolase, partial [Verrucomicrobiae bacterium]|nr:serine hydrolase [Verrucomicrobiae bacterium]